MAQNSLEILEIEADFPGKLAEILFEPHRYKVIYGGRGGGRSWGCARALLLKAVKHPIRVACVREIQESIKKSVHQLLKDQISLLGLKDLFDIQETIIRGKSGAEFIFTGLSNITKDSIKSMEGCDIAWCEEAQTITKESWSVLIPTIRKEESEIWITFNPSLSTDETYKRFVTETPPNCVKVLLNYHDNPFFPEILEQERIHCKKTDPDNYPNIWEGACKPAVEGAIYFKQIQSAEKNGQICRVPYDPMLKVHVIMDLGFGHNMSVGCVQKNMSEIRVIDYFQVQGWDLNDVSIELRKRRYNWGRVWLPHDGFSKDHKTKTTSQAILQRQGWDVPDRSEIIEMSVEEGIRLVQMMFPQIYFDAGKCGDVRDETKNGGMITGGLLECIRRYRRNLNRVTNTFTTPAQDQFTDGNDFLRYVCQNAQSMHNTDSGEFWNDISQSNQYSDESVCSATGY